MKGKDIIDHAVRAEMPDMEQLRESCIHQATLKTSKNGIWIKRLIPTTACMALIIAVALVFPNFNGIIAQPGQKQTSEKEPPDTNYNLYIPAIELHEAPEGVQMDMIGLFVYKGRIYTQASYYYDEEVTAIRDLVGERLGYATGNINEWSTQDDYAVEFAGSVEGDVYSVKGYSEDFRLCMMGSYMEDTGDIVQWVNFYENLNGIGLTSGYDLFGERLQLRDNWSHVKYQEHDNWDNPGSLGYVYRDLEEVSDEEISAFVEALYASDFEYVYDENLDFYTDSQKQAHLYFYMNDGTVIALRLFEGGYVGYQHLGWYFVKMPGEAFDSVFSVCN